MSTWKRYLIENEQEFRRLVGYDAAEDSTEPTWPEDAEISAAGFDPEDHEVSITTLAEDWNGHPKGSRVIGTLALRDHSFAVEQGE